MPQAGIRANAFQRLPAASALILAGWSGTAFASDAAITPADWQSSPVKIELIDSSRLGCGQSMPLWTATTGGPQCAFDTATRGARVTALQEFGSGSIEAYATMARSTVGAYSPDRLLASPETRTNETANLFLVGFKGSVFDNRMKLTAEFARTERVVENLLDRDWALADWNRRDGTSASVRLDATLANSADLKWILTGEYRSVSDGYSVGSTPDLFRYYAIPGTRLALSSKARIGEFGMSAGMEQVSSPFGETSSRKASFDFQGLSITLRSRATNATPIEGSTLLDSSTRANAAYFDLDTPVLAAWLFPNLEKLPVFVPTSINLSYRTGETDDRYDATVARFGLSSLGIDAGWETPLGETGFSYWRDRRIGLDDGTRSRSTETVQVDHMVRRGNWRFGVDVSISRTSGEGSSDYSERSVSFGQSVAYSAPNGPEFRLQLGQDRGHMRFADDSYASADSYSSITASLDLSRYLQKRFERPDLRLMLDYRKALERSDSEMSLYDQLVEHWDDRYRREGLLVSFGMKL
jgi:hypothetical protein